MTHLRFAKMAGAANDFIVVDNRQAAAAGLTPGQIRQLCTRRFSVGADGLMLLGEADDADFTMRYFNADGSEAAMCGNGGRCLARFAVLVGAAREGQKMTFIAPSGRYQAWVTGTEVKLNMLPPKNMAADIRLQILGQERVMDFIDTGVPHAVLFTEDLRSEDVAAVGRIIRYHEYFAPAGTNVNFCQVTDTHHLAIRTYERGVEGETLACGTGAAAAALLAARRGLVESPVLVRTASGVALTLTFKATRDSFTDIYQQGEARLIYWGEQSAEALAFTVPSL